MKLITLNESTLSENKLLKRLFIESKEHFFKIEGREPLAPLVDINKVIPEIPKEACHCLSIYYFEQLIGYLWVFDDSPTSFYILHFYISEQYRNLGFGKLALRELENSYYNQQLKTAELVVSGVNFVGLKFWQSVGFDKIIDVYKPDEIGSFSTELELQKNYSFHEKDIVLLLPFERVNNLSRSELILSEKQTDATFALSVPEAIKEASKNLTMISYLICLNNEVVGYTSLAFDETDLKSENRNWLCQYTIKKSDRSKAYAEKVMPIIINHFLHRGVPDITLSINASNEQAKEFYQKFGFVHVGHQGVNKILMKKTLF